MGHPLRHVLRSGSRRLRSRYRRRTDRVETDAGGGRSGEQRVAWLPQSLPCPLTTRCRLRTPEPSPLRGGRITSTYERSPHNSATESTVSLPAAVTYKYLMSAAAT